MQSIRAWRKSGDGDGYSPSATFSPMRRGGSTPTTPSSTDPGLGHQRLTEIFSQARKLDYSEKIEDGFRDIGGQEGISETSTTDGSGPSVVLVDRGTDSFLAEFIERISKKILRANDTVTKVMVASLLVSEVLGRSGYHASNLTQRHERLLQETADPATNSVKLGDVMHEQAAPGTRARQPGAGTSRHRAVLLKAVADWLGIAPCALHRDLGGATWNTVLVEGDAFVVDVMFDPGALYEQGSGKADEYLRRLAHEGGTSASTASSGRKKEGSPAAPSMQQGLTGRMLRPSWHVEPWEIDFDRRDRAGRGGFGEVFQGAWAGQPTAVKEVRDANPTDGDVSDFILEISLLSRLSHPNIIRFWRGCVDLRGGHRTLLLVTEWMDRGVLSQLLHESQEANLTIGQIHVLSTGIGLGVQYLHHVKILHLDLKSPNVLLNSYWQPKLCDFGLAKLREQTALHTTLRGVSPIWAPPEMFDDKAGGLTEKADVYSFGILIFELACRKLPYSDISPMQLPRVKAKGQLPKFPEDMDNDLSDLAKLCLSRIPASRPSMTKVIQQVQQMATSRGVELREEQAKMEQRGLHFGGPQGSTPNVEQLRRAEAEKRRAELEVARLRKLLQEEEGRVRLLEQASGGGGGGGGAEDAEAARQLQIEEFCASKTQAVGDSKFRCTVCRKLFRGPEFVHKHVKERHLDEMLGAASSGLVAGAAADRQRADGEATPSVGEGTPAVRSSDKFFDADVAEESTAITYTCRIGGDAPGGAADGFYQALQDAAEAGDLSKLQQCLVQGVQALNQVDVDGCVPLHLASKGGHVECVQYLISKAGDVAAANESGLTPLHMAAQEGHGPTCELLIQANAMVDNNCSTKSRTPLHLAAANGHKEVCGILLALKANVNLQDTDGESPLHNAARFGDRELCEVILSFGASVSVADNDGWSPLHEAARWGDGELVESLLQRGADLAHCSNDGESALHVVPGGYAEFEVVEVLLRWKCDVNGKDYDGETPLHVAVKLGDAELATVLLDHRAEPNATNNAGATPLDFAKKDEIRWLLRSHKARKGSGAP